MNQNDYVAMQVRLAVSKGKQNSEIFVDLFTKEDPARVESIVKAQASRAFMFPHDINVYILPEDSRTYQPVSSSYQVVSVLSGLLCNLLYNAL